MIALTLTLLLSQAQKTGTPAEVKADYEMVCNVIERSGAAKETDPSKKAQTAATYLFKHLKTKQVLSQMQSMGSVRPEDKVKVFKAAAAKAGYTGPCPFLEME